MRRQMFFAGLMAVTIIPSLTMAFTLREATLKNKAYMMPTAEGVYEALDLRSKTYTFNQTDFDSCAQQMKRQSRTLAFSCTVDLNTKNEQSKLRTVISQPVVQVPFGGVKKFVHMEVSGDARSVTFSMRLDDTGVDHQVAQFNDEFYKVESKVAQLIISEAMTVAPLQIQVLESAQTEPTPAVVYKIKKSRNGARL